MKTAVTGGSGVVGRAVVNHLVRAGHEVSALVRTEAASATVSSLGAAPILGDVLDLASLFGFVSGADWVFHVAGVNEICSMDPDRMDRVNIEGSRNVLTACAAQGVMRLIHTSSAAALGEKPGDTGSESTSHRGRYLTRYERSKHLSEVLMLSGSGKLDVVVVNPASVQGPGRATGTGRLILDLLRGSLPFLIDARISIVDIDDCAAGHLLAASRGLAGERYVLSGASLKVSEAVEMLVEVTGSATKVRYLPGWIAAIAGAAVETAARATRRRPTVCRETIRVMRAGASYDGSRAERDLGLSYTPLRVTMARTVEWFREQGLLV